MMKPTARKQPQPSKKCKVIPNSSDKTTLASLILNNIVMKLETWKANNNGKLPQGGTTTRWKIEYCCIEGSYTGLANKIHGKSVIKLDQKVVLWVLIWQWLIRLTCSSWTSQFQSLDATCRLFSCLFFETHPHQQLICTCLPSTTLNVLCDDDGSRILF